MIVEARETTVAVTPAELVARILDAVDRTGDLDWSLVRVDFEIHDHELPDSSVHRGRQGWRQWVTDWQEAFEDYSIDRIGEVEVDEARVLTVHRLRARGRLSGVRLERTDAQLWTFRDERLVRMDYFPDFREHEHTWATPGGGGRRPPYG
jgi:ketosteroid isomerase-like protein